jgi:hypothetical protein
VVPDVLVTGGGGGGPVDGLAATLMRYLADGRGGNGAPAGSAPGAATIPASQPDGDSAPEPGSEPASEPRGDEEPPTTP